MDHDEQLRIALNLLGLKSGCRTADDVERVSAAIGAVHRAAASHEAARWALSKQSRGDLIGLRDELRRVRARLNSMSHGPRQAWFPDLDADLRKYEQRCERIEQQHWNKDQPRQRRSAFKERIAAMQAHRLLAHFGVPAKRSRNGTWCRLAAVLYGDEKADLYKHCCDYVASG